MPPLRNSGIFWLGEIPAHWEIVRLRFLVTDIEQGWSPEAAMVQPGLDEWGVLKLNAVCQGRFDETATKTLPPERQPRADLEVRPGDVLVTRSNTPSLVGDACFVETTRPKLMLSDIIYRLAIRTGVINGRFLVSFLILPLGRVQIENDARGTSASMVKISQAHIKNWWIPVPPIPEQRSIIAALAGQTRAIDQTRAAIERTITLIKERRSALIAAAVTGRIDVGGPLMRYREPLPQGCPPDAAEEISTAWRVFRLVRTNPPTDRDFRSQRAERPAHGFRSVSECRARGLSVFAARQDAERALKLPGLRGRLLCGVEAGAGHIQQTGRPSHHTWWPLADFNIPARCAMETP